MIKPPKKKRKIQPYRYVQTEDGQWNRVTNDEAGRVFQGLTIRPKKSGGTITKYVPEKYDNSIEEAYRRAKWLQTHDAGTGKVIYEPGLETVSPEFDVLSVSPLIKYAGKYALNKVADLAKPMYNATADLATNAIDKARWLYNEGNIFNARMKYNPENFYRVVGQDAIEDANLTGLIRANPNSAFKVPYFGYKRLNPSLRARGDRSIIEGSPESAETWADSWRYDSRKSFIEDKLKNLTSEIRSMKDSEMSQLYTDQEVQALLKERAFWKDLSDHSFRDIREAPTTRPLSTEYFEEISQNKPGWMMEFGTETFPSNAGSTSVPVDNFVYWRRYPILGWRANSFRTASGSRSSLPKISQK